MSANFYVRGNGTRAYFFTKGTGLGTMAKIVPRAKGWREMLSDLVDDGIVYLTSQNNFGAKVSVA